MKAHIKIPYLLIPIPLAAATLLSFSCFQATPRVAAEITIAAPPLEQNALLYVAAEKGFFARHGLKVDIKNFDTGPAAMAAVRDGLAQIAETAEFPLVADALNGGDFRIIAANDRFENDYLVARKDGGISTLADLRGKRIGVSLHTITEFFLSRFLVLNEIAANAITLVDIKPADFVASMADKKVDAIVAWQPAVSKIVALVPGNATVWNVQADQRVYGILVCRGPWLETHGREAEALLASLQEAKSFLSANPSKARAIVAKKLAYDDSYLASIWPKHQFGLTLDFSMVAAMEDEARWMIKNRLTEATILPDFARLIYVDALDAVNREGVNMMR
ncbi:MAG TPA: NrtA/SsuA/CpmA family ABC transporter substrate-binding protein [Rectinemataceae bacterium]|nr:NrtA/SsuA/CpmA family ABC transporter substrate-binding protein [Rectinemataceae bacterium]